MFSGDFDPRPKTVEIWERTEKTRLCVNDILDDRQFFTKPVKYLFTGLLFLFNPFVPNASFLYPWKHQKALRFSDL